MAESKRLHLIHNYLLDPPHAVTVALVGAGGNGSLLLTHLGRLHLALLANEHPGLMVCCYDDKDVTGANVGRQAFSIHDIGKPKAKVIIDRANAYYGTRWTCMMERFNPSVNFGVNIIITCTDNAKSRYLIHKIKRKKDFNVHDKSYLYWLDIGNLHNTGQVILSTVKAVNQKTRNPAYSQRLRNVIEIFGKAYKDADPTDHPSCSLAEALDKQDLLINPMMTTLAAKLLWDMFTRIIMDYHGFFVNLEDLTIKPLMINGTTKNN